MNRYTILFVFLDAFGVTATKYFFTLGIHPYFFVLITGLLTSGFLFAYLGITKQFNYSLFSLKTIKKSLPSALFIALANLFGFLSLKIIPATYYILLFRTSLFMIPILAWLILREKINFKLFPLALVAIIGVWLLTGDWRLIISLSGYSLALLAALMSSLDFIYQKQASIAISKDVVVFWRRLISALLVGSIWWFTPGLGTANWNYFFWFVIFSFGFFLLSLTLIRALKSQPVADFNLLANLTPILVGLLSWWFLKEILTIEQLFGAGLILGSILVYNLLNKYDPRRHSRPERVKIC